MKKINKHLQIKVLPVKAFKKFVNELNEWWPKEYTWSQDRLKEIKIESRKDGRCTEIGPYGFRCDWGTVTEFKEFEKLSLKWQIGPNREPIPNPDKASDINVIFTIGENATTDVEFDHFNFENHGESSDSYRKMMDSEQGWDYILNSFKTYCEKGDNF